MVPTHLRSLLGLEDTPNRHFDTVLQGRGSYEIGLTAGHTNAYRHLRSIVFSTTMTQSPDPSVELRTDPLQTVRELKQETGAGIWLCGGGRLAATLRPEIDEIVLKRSEEHTSELQSRGHLVCRLLLEKKNRNSKADDK